MTSTNEINSCVRCLIGSSLDPIQNETKMLLVDASVSVSTDNANDTDDLIDGANFAMYHAKHVVTNKFCYYATSR